MAPLLIFLVVVGILVATVLLVMILKCIVAMVIRAAGFREEGVAANSMASSFMGSYGGYVPSNSACANFQSMGATGDVCALRGQRGGRNRSLGCCRCACMCKFVITVAVVAALIVLGYHFSPQFKEFVLSCAHTLRDWYFIIRDKIEDLIPHFSNLTLII